MVGIEPMNFYLQRLNIWTGGGTKKLTNILPICKGNKKKNCMCVNKIKILFFLFFFLNHYEPVNQSNWCNMAVTFVNLFPPPSFLKNHYAPVSQANWCNMTFTACNLFPSHSYIGWPESSSHRDSNPGPQRERQMTYQLSYPSPPQDPRFKIQESWS